MKRSSELKHYGNKKKTTSLKIHSAFVSSGSDAMLLKGNSLIIIPCRAAYFSKRGLYRRRAMDATWLVGSDRQATGEKEAGGRGDRKGGGGHRSRGSVSKTS